MPHWFQHAFAIDPPGTAEPTDRQRVIVDRLCQEIIRRRLTTPALMALEMSQPLNFVAAQSMHFLSPFLSAITDAQGCRSFAEFLERRGAIDYITRHIAELERRADAPATGGENGTARTSSLDD